MKDKLGGKLMTKFVALKQKNPELFNSWWW